MGFLESHSGSETTLHQEFLFSNIYDSKGVTLSANGVLKLMEEIVSIGKRKMKREGREPQLKR